MRRRSSWCIGGGVALAAIALLWAPLALAGDVGTAKSPAQGIERVQQHATQAVKAATRTEGRTTKPVSETSARQLAATADRTVVHAVAEHASVPRWAGLVKSYGPLVGQADGLRAPGDNETQLYSRLVGNSFSSTIGNDVGEDIVVATAPSGQAWSIDEISFAVLRISSTTVPTWARIKVWQTYDLDAASAPDCIPDNPVHTGLLGTVIVNLGTDDNELCDTYDRVRVNLITGEVYSIFDEAVIDPAGVIANSSPTGWIPAGAGGSQFFISFEFGQPNGTNDDIIDGPNDACAANPGGRPIFDATGQPADVGGSNAAFYVDSSADFSNNNGTWDCNEFVGFGAQSGYSMSLRGSLGIDCNTNGLIDDYEILVDPSLDDGTECLGAGAGNDVLDECECGDCNENGVPDATDILMGTSQDCQPDYRPDECQLGGGNDCNGNMVPDVCDITSGFSQDCQPNGIPDSCDVDPADPDLSGTVWTDCDGDGVPDGCQRFGFDCNNNGIDDYCDILAGEANDQDNDGVPDACNANALTVVLDFENTGDLDSDYIVGPVHDQPFEGGLVIADWRTFNDGGESLVDLPGAGYADVTAGSLTTGCSDADTQYLELKEQNPIEDWATLSPHIYFSDPAVSTVTATVPVYQEIKMNLEFTAGLSAVDWDFYMTSLFDPFVNSSRILVSFDSASDGETEIVLYTDTITTTGVNWAANLNTTHELRVTIDLTNATAIDPLTNAGKVYWDGVEIATFTPTVGVDEPLLIDSVYFDQFDDTELGNPSANSTVKVDCITLIRSEGGVACSDYLLPNGEPSGDCNQDGICDVFQFDQFFDRNNNYVFDFCEGYCNDCNHNFIPDDVEIAGGTAVDTTPANGVPDVCEGSHNVDFTSFALGEIDDQMGWDGSVSGAVAEIVNDGAFTGSKYLKIASDGSNAANPFALVMGPRIDTEPADGQAEFWSWKMQVNSPTQTQPNFGAVFVEIADLCEDQPESPEIIQSIALEANTGFGLSTVELSTGTALDRFQIYLLQTVNNARDYQPVGADVTAAFRDGIRAVGLKIENRGGTVKGYVGANQGTLFSSALNLLPAGANLTETQRFLDSGNGDLIAGSRWAGGDRQIWIRTDGDFGAEDNVEFWFDDFQYTTGLDCDGDGFDDAQDINDRGGSGGVGGPLDRNNNGVLDRCEDCDIDIPTSGCSWVDNGFGFELSNPLCTNYLDPAEAQGNDCNANGIPDFCDVMEDRPNQDTNNDFYYAGGGSCDANSNGVPDECDGGQDCNNNGCIDSGEIANGAPDVDGDGIPDECETDCNGNGVPDDQDVFLTLANGGSQDADNAPFPVGTGAPDGFPDECCVDMSADPNVLKQPDGDMDVDGDVDAADYKLVQECAGKRYPADPQPEVGEVFQSAKGGFLGWDRVMCGCADFNGDGYVNSVDLEAFKLLITGPQ